MWRSLLAVGIASTAPLCLAGVGQEPLQDLHDLEPSKKHFKKLTHDLVGFHKNLSEIESITYNEAEAGKWLVESLTSQGYHVEKQHMEDDDSRFNVLAWPGKTRETKILVTAHYDTVPPFYPYKIQKFEHNTTISGRGSVDDKASVAAQLVAVNTLLSEGKISAEDVSLLFVVGEETGGDGMRAANSLGLKPKTIVFGEPTDAKLVSGHKGNMGLTIRAKGKAAHSGYPWLGRSANEVLVRVLAALIDRADDLPKSEKYGDTTLNVGKIEGGVAGNVVPESAQAQIQIRLADGSPSDVRVQLQAWVDEAVEGLLEEGMKPRDVVEIEWASAGYGPVDLDVDVPGFDVFTVNYGTDVPWLKRTVEGQKRYLYGPGSIFVAHSDHEALTQQDLEDAVGAYQKLILHALGKWS